VFSPARGTRLRPARGRGGPGSGLKLAGQLWFDLVLALR